MRYYKHRSANPGYLYVRVDEHNNCWMRMADGRDEPAPPSWRDSVDRFINTGIWLAISEQEALTLEATGRGAPAGSDVPLTAVKDAW